MYARMSLAVLLAAVIIPQALTQATPAYNHTIPEKDRDPAQGGTPFGTHQLFDGVSYKATVEKVCDKLDLIRGTEAFLNGIPAASLDTLLNGNAGLWATSSKKVVIMETYWTRRR